MSKRKNNNLGWAVLWDKRQGLKWDNIDQIVETAQEAKSCSDISGDSEAQINTPHKGYVKILMSIVYTQLPK